MDFCDRLVIEIVRLIGLVVVGTAITAMWNARQKRREMDLSSLSDLYSCYGRFIATRRMWNHLLETENSVAADEEEKARLWTVANELEGEIEAILMRVTSEKKLDPDELARLGHLRQAFQSLREAMRSDAPLEFGSSEHEDYVALKEGTLFLASVFKRVFAIGWRPSPEVSRAAFAEITSNKYEK